MANVIDNSPRVEVVYDFRNEATDEKPGTVHVRVYEVGGKRRYVSTGVRVLPVEWNDEYKMVVGRMDAAHLNTLIREQMDECVGKIKSAMAESARTGAAIRMPESERMKVDRRDAPFIDWLREQIDYHEQYKILKEATIDKHRVLLGELEEYGKIKKWGDVTPQNIRQFIDSIRLHEVGKLDAATGEVEPTAVCQATVYTYFKNLRKWLRIAMRDGYVPTNLLEGIKIDKGDDGDREHLNLEELRKLIDAKMQTPHQAKVRDIFLVQCATGMAYGNMMATDWSQLEDVEGQKVLADRRTKNRSQFITVVLPFGCEALDRLGGSVPKISNQKYNSGLVEVMTIAGIDKHITTHCARHTFACICIQTKVNIVALQRALGHKNVRTTQIYSKLYDREIIKDFGNVKI